MCCLPSVLTRILKLMGEYAQVRADHHIYSSSIVLSPYQVNQALLHEAAQLYALGLNLTRTENAKTEF